MMIIMPWNTEKITRNNMIERRPSGQWCVLMHWRGWIEFDRKYLHIQNFMPWATSDALRPILSSTPWTKSWKSCTGCYHLNCEHSYYKISPTRRVKESVHQSIAYALSRGSMKKVHKEQQKWNRVFFYLLSLVNKTDDNRFWAHIICFIIS